MRLRPAGRPDAEKVYGAVPPVAPKLPDMVELGTKPPNAPELVKVSGEGGAGAAGITSVLLVMSNAQALERLLGNKSQKAGAAFPAGVGGVVNVACPAYTNELVSVGPLGRFSDCVKTTV